MSTNMSSNRYLGKYREIITAVAFFLVFDLAVLVLNFYVSFQISASAVEINLAGRQRMLSQKMTKELLIAERESFNSIELEQAAKDMAKTVYLFDQSLLAFKQGGMVQGGNDKLVQVNAVTDADGLMVLHKADAIWQPWYKQVSTFLDNPNDTLALIAASNYARQNNAEMLKLMNQLTTKLEQNANKRADDLRLVQTIGILLALLNFAFILFKFIRRLRDNDAKIEQAQGETVEILATVKEGLFLLDHDFKIGSQFSASLGKILGHDIKEGTDFKEILAELVGHKSYKAACEYIKLLLGNRVKESLVQDLNPLTNTEVTINGQKRYLTLSFNRALKQGKVSHLLVTVFDVTAQVELERDLAEARQKAKSEMEVLLNLLKVNPLTLKQYLMRAEQELLRINEQLRHVEAHRDYRRIVSQIFRQVHALKGEAAVLGLVIFEELAHKFELILVELRDKGTVTGNDLLAIPLPLDEFLQRIGYIRELSQRLAAFQSAFPDENNEAILVTQMENLAQRIATDHAKSVNLTADLFLLGQLPATVRNDINNISLQLLRNAIVHGIESKTERLKYAKPETGNVHISLQRVGDDYELSMRDDGQGLIPQQIRQSLINKGLYSPAQLEQLSDKQVIMKIFETGFSTATISNKDAGHGVGLDVVHHLIQKLGASLKISSKEHHFTQFDIRFAVTGES